MPKSCLPQTHLHIFHTSGKAREYSADTPGYVCCMSEPDVGTLIRSGLTRPQQNSNPGGFCKRPTKVRRQWSVRPECPRPGCSLPFPHPARQEEVSSSATSWSNGPRHLSRSTVERVTGHHPALKSQIHKTSSKHPWRHTPAWSISRPPESSPESCRPSLCFPRPSRHPHRELHSPEPRLPC